MMSKFLLLFLVLFPTFCAAASFRIGQRNKHLRDNFVAVVMGLELAAAIALMLGGEASVRIGGVLGMGLHFAADGFRCLMALIAAIGWFEATLMLREYFAHSHFRNRYYAFWLLTLTGTVGVFLSADLFTTFVFFEIMSFASWVLVINTEKPDALKAGETYLAVAVIGGLTTLMGIFMLYNLLGTLEIDALYDAASAVENTSYLWAAGLLTFVGFAAKAGSFPLHIWLPTAHPAAPAPASAVLSGVIIKTGVFGILVLSTQVFRYNYIWGMLMLTLGVITMVLGAVLAVFSIDLKRTFACSSVSQIGFILTGIAMQCLLGHHNALAVDGTLLHIVNHASVKLILFPAAGVIYCTTHTFDFNKIRGFGKNKPLLMLVMGIPMASLAGVPGLNGYVSKTLLHESIVEYIHLVPESAALFTAVEWAFLFAGGLTAAYMLKVFICLFVCEPAVGAHWVGHKPYATKLSIGTLLTLAAVMPVLGLLPNRIMDGMAAMGRGFMHGHAPDHAVHYFAWVNLKGALISLCIGTAVYLLVIRPLLTERDCSGVHYPNRWPEKINLEMALYRPLILTVLPFIGAIFARLGETLVDGTVAMLAKLLYYGQTRTISPNVDEKFAAYDREPKPRIGFRYSFAYSIILMGVGLSLCLLYVLIKG